MRYVTIPADVVQKFSEVEQGPTPPPRTRRFVELVMEWLGNVEQFGKGSDAIRSGRKLEAAFEGKGAGDIVAIEDADFQRLVRAVEDTTYVPAVGRCLVPFVDAVIEAKKERPA